MLPGLRILFAITFLSVSVVIFGLGAAAFLRSAHEDVANAPWRPIETPATARVDLAPTTLSMLRVEPEASIAALTARADAAAAIDPPSETKPESAADPAPVVTPEPPRAEQAPISPVKSPEPPAAAQAGPPAVPPTIVAAVEQASAIAEANPAETKAAETKTPEAKAAGTADAQPSPTVVAALTIDRVEQTQPKSVFEPASAPQESLDLPLTAAASLLEAKAGADTLKADDKAIRTAKVAALGEPATAETPPLPSKDVKIPNPRVDPAVLDARRKQQQQIVVQQRARARAAVRARRAAVRARAAAQAKAAATNPFGAPANSTSNNIRTN